MTAAGLVPSYLRGLPMLAVATAAMYVGGALMLGAALATWSPGKNPRWVIGAMVLAALVFAAYALVRGSRLTRGEALGMVSAQVTSIAVLSWRTDVDLAALTNGAVLPIIGAYATWLLHPVGGRTVVYAGAVAWAVAVLGRDDPDLTSGVLSTLLQTVLAAEALGLLHRRIDRLTHTDELTGLLNRRGIFEYAERELAHARRRGRPLSLALVDIDGLREVNNRAGHSAGDALIRTIADFWAGLSGPGVRIGRIGGDEFVVVLPGHDTDSARRILADAAARSPHPWTSGVAEAGPRESLDEVRDRADREMYAAKPRPTTPD